MHHTKNSIFPPKFLCTISTISYLMHRQHETSCTSIWEKIWPLGGQLSLPTCFYYLMLFIWAGTFFPYAMKNEVNGEITINTTTLNPTQEETPDLIQRLEPDDAQQTLGIHIAPMGTGKFYLTMLNGGATASPNKED